MSTLLSAMLRYITLLPSFRTHYTMNNFLVLYVFNLQYFSGIPLNLHFYHTSEIFKNVKQIGKLLNIFFLLDFFLIIDVILFCCDFFLSFKVVWIKNPVNEWCLGGLINVSLYLNINILTFRNQLQLVLPDSLTTWEIQGVGISNSGKQV